MGMVKKNMYMITEEEFEKIKNGELKKEEIINPSRKALITWTGEDIKHMLSRKNKHTLSDNELSEIIQNIKKALEWCDCAMCVENAFEYALKKQG